MRCSAEMQKNVGANLVVVPRACGLQVGLGLYVSIVATNWSCLYDACISSLRPQEYHFIQKDVTVNDWGFQDKKWIH